MDISREGIITHKLTGTEGGDRSWMTTFWEVFADCVIEMDDQLIITHLLKKPGSTFAMDDIVGKHFLSPAVDGDKASVMAELELLKQPGVTYRRFTFLSFWGRYYRMTLAPAYTDGFFAGLHGIAVDVTEEKRKEVTLNWQRAVIEGSDEYIGISNPMGEVLYTSPGAFKMTGYDPAMSNLSREMVHPPEYLRVIDREAIPQAVSSGQWTGRGVLVRADGSHLPIDQSIFTVKDENGKVILIATIIRDITDFVEHENAMRSQQRQTELLASVAMSFSLSDDFDANVNSALEAIGSYVGGDTMYIFRDVKESNSYSVDYLWAKGQNYGMYTGRRIPYIDIDTGCYTPEYQLLQDVPIFASDDLSTLSDDLFAKARMSGAKSTVNLPIHVGGEFWGIIGINMYSRLRSWNDSELSFLKTICGILSTSIAKRLMAERWQAAQTNLQAVLDNVPSAIFWKDKDLVYRGGNRRFMEFFGIKNGGFIGKRAADVLESGYAAHTDRRDIALLHSGKDRLHEYEQVMSASGKMRWVTQNRVIMRGEDGTVSSLLGVFDDITENRENEQRVAETLSQLKTVVGNYPGLIWSLDLGRRFTLYDGSSLAQAGADAPGIIGSNIHAYAQENPGVLHPSMPEKVELTFGGEPQNWEFDLGNVAFRCNTMPILDGKGDIIGVVGASVDVTSMIQLQKELVEARKAAELASNAKSEFLSRMSHEIRTPMNAIIGMTQIARGNSDMERIGSCLTKIDNASKHLLALINDILDLSKIEANKLELQNETFDLEKCVLNIRSMIAVRVEEKAQSFNLELDDALPMFVVGDELRFTQIIINLLGNAIKFTPEAGSVSLSVSERERNCEHCVIEVRVRDNGIGLSPEQQSKLFTAFEQADGSVTRKYGGTGLGLAICKRIVEMMGGSIWVESALGEGSTFAFTVKMRLSDHAAQLQVAAEKKFIHVDDIKKLRILAVDDSAESLDYLSHILGRFSLVCDRACDGTEAVDRVKRAVEADAPYDIIFMDYKMPHMDGITAARRIVELMPSGVALIMVSVTDWHDIEDEARSAGIARYIVKPFSPSSVFDIINEVTGAALADYANKDTFPADSDLSGFNVLLVEDVDINREIVYAMLEDTHLGIETAENGRQAVELFAAAPGKYDMILMDVQMPEMDGMEATRRIRAMDVQEAKDIVIVAMTANVFKEDVDKCRAAGMNDHIAKPIDNDILLEKLTDYLFMKRYISEKGK